MTRDQLVGFAMVVAGIAVMVAVTIGAVYGMRSISSAATPVRLYSPKPGITCATMVTGDGAAISCWKD